MLQKYGITDSVQIEDTENRILLRNHKNIKLLWEDTVKALKKENENQEDEKLPLYCNRLDQR